MKICCCTASITLYFSDAEETLETIYLPNPFYRIDDLNQLELQMRITSTRHIWENSVRNLMYLINTQQFIQEMVSYILRIMLYIISLQ